MIIRMVGTGSVSSKRNCACALVNEEILLDCGGGIIKALLAQNVEVKKIKTVLITHLHGDHYADLPNLIFYRYLCHINSKLIIFVPLDSTTKIRRMFELYYSDLDFNNVLTLSRVELKEFDEMSDVAIESSYTVSALPVLHGKIKPAYGYLLRCGNESVFYSGDAAMCESVERGVKIADLSILDMSLERGDLSHMGIDDIKNLLEDYKKPVVATHMRDKTRNLAIDLAYKNLFIAEDGATLSI